MSIQSCSMVRLFILFSWVLDWYVFVFEPVVELGVGQIALTQPRGPHSKDIVLAMLYWLGGISAILSHQSLSGHTASAPETINEK